MNTNGRRTVVTILSCGVFAILGSAQDNGAAPVAAQAAGPVGTSFTYQGHLTEGGNPANDAYDFIFRLFDSDGGGGGGQQVGSDVVVDDWGVVDGLFTVQLDFGNGIFTGNERWLEVSVRPGQSNDSHTVLSPRQPLTATPYALYALSGPGSGGPWASSGNDVYSTNTGNVGIGTSTPLWKLDVANPTPGGSVEVGVSANDAGGALAAYSSTFAFPHFADRVSLFTNAVTATGLDLRADGSTSDIRLYAGGFGPEHERMRITGTGHVGIGTATPTAQLEVVDPTGEHNAISASSRWVGVYGLHDGSGSFPGVWGESNSITFGATGVRGFITSTDPGEKSAGVLGHNKGTTSNGYGVRGVHDGTGYGVYGISDGVGVYGSSRLTGVYGIHTGDTGTFPGVWGETNSRSTSATGVRGIIVSTAPGSGSTGVLGYNKGTSSNGYGVKGIHDGAGTGVYGVSAGTGVFGESTTAFPGVIGKSRDGRGVWGESINGPGVYGSSTNGYAGFFDGTVSVNVLEIAGADVAEKFPVSEEVKPGMVVAIDPDHPGKLCLSRGAYNRRVAGVVSGAGGIPTGAILGNLPGHEDAPPIALSGRVWVHCDATAQPIEPGDLLTTSATPGHGMAVTDHSRAMGATFGKAMTSLAEGETGMVLVLVNLQ